MDRVTKHAFKTELFEQFAEVGKALASPVRLQIIELLAQTEHSVEAVCGALDLPIANVSQHLQVLKRARLVVAKKRGPYMVYDLSDPAAFGLWQAVRSFGEAQIAEIDRLVQAYLTDRKALKGVGPEELLTRMSEGTVVIDVRPHIEFQAGHIPGARSIPVEELEARLAELPVEAEVVAYCRGPYCIFADEAVALLSQRGLRASRLTVGLPDWQALGLPIEKSTEENQCS